MYLVFSKEKEKPVGFGLKKKNRGKEIRLKKKKENFGERNKLFSLLVGKEFR